MFTFKMFQNILNFHEKYTESKNVVSKETYKIFWQNPKLNNISKVVVRNLF